MLDQLQPFQPPSLPGAVVIVAVNTRSQHPVALLECLFFILMAAGPFSGVDIFLLVLPALQIKLQLPAPARLSLVAVIPMEHG